MGRPPLRESARTRAPPTRGLHLVCHNLESQRQETIASQDGRRLVKRPVAGRPAPSQIVVIHRRQIVVNQRISMNHLQAHAAGIAESDSPPHASAAIRHKTGRSRLPPPKYAITHRHRQPRRTAGAVGRVDLGQVATERLLDPRGTCPDTRPALTP